MFTSLVHEHSVSKGWELRILAVLILKEECFPNSNLRLSVAQQLEISFVVLVLS